MNAALQPHADVQRALSIIESLVTELEGREGEADGEEDSVEALLALQATFVRMQSPLFSALIDIASRYQEVCCQ